MVTSFPKSTDRAQEFAALRREVGRISEEAAELQELQAALREQVGCAKINLQGDLTRADETYAKIVGWSLSELHDRPFILAIAPESRSVLVKAFRDSHAEGHAICEVRTQGKEEHGWAEVTLTPSYRSSSLQGYLCLLRDITHRKRTEEQIALLNQQLRERVRELRYSQSRFESFLDNSPLYSWMKEYRQGEEWGRYVYMNRAYREAFNLSEADLGRTDWEIWPDSADQFRENDLHVLKTGSLLRTVEQGNHGGPRSWLIWKFPFEFDGIQYVGGKGQDLVSEPGQAPCSRCPFGPRAEE